MKQNANFVFSISGPDLALGLDLVLDPDLADAAIVRAHAAVVTVGTYCVV